MPTCTVRSVFARTTDEQTANDHHITAGYACDRCTDRVATILTEIARQFAALDATPGRASRGSAITGSREQPLGVRVAVLDLIARPGTGTVHDPHHDQIGHVPAIAQLDSWVTDWIAARDQHERRPVPTVPVLTRWLRDRLDWAARHHPAIDDFATEMRALLGALRAANGDVDARPEHKVGVPCSRCDLMTLYVSPGDRYVECGSCGVLQTPDEYDRWVRLVAASIPEGNRRDR